MRHKRDESSNDSRNQIYRLYQIQYILNYNPRGITFKELAEKCGVSLRTIKRDIDALGSIDVQIWQDDGRVGISPEYRKTPIMLSQQEAMMVFIAARLMLSYSNAYNKNIETTFMKLCSIVPVPLREQIKKTLEWMKKNQKVDKSIEYLDALGRAWIEGRKIEIYYNTPDSGAKLRVIEPYYIQPAAWGHANYVIAYDNLSNEIRTFKVDRIKSYKLLKESYKVPRSFDVNEYLGTAWGIMVYDKADTVKLKVDKSAAVYFKETVYHPSQVVETQPDGSVIVIYKVSITPEFEGFILSWGNKLEVMEPKSLRRKMFTQINNIIKKYKTD